MAKSYITAYLLWFFFGWLGVHRFYVRKYFTGFLYAISFGFYGIGWGLDFFLTYFMVRSANQRIFREKETESKEAPLAEMPSPEELPPWAKERSILDYLLMPFQLIFFLFAPSILVAAAILFQQWDIAIVTAAILIATGFLGPLRNAMKDISLRKIPAIKEALSIVQQFQEHYFQHKPRSFLFYFFYPIFGFIGLLFSRSLRKEFRLYMKIVNAIALLLIVENLFSYFSIYPPHLKWDDAAFIILVQVLISVFIIAIFMMPMATTAFKWSLCGHRRTVFPTLAALLFAMLVGAHGYFAEKDSLSFVSSGILGRRMKKPSFQSEFGEVTEMFLLYHSKCPPKIPQSSPEIHSSLTQKYRRLIGNLAVRDEARAFSIVTFQEGDGNFVWIGVRFTPDVNGKKPVMLYFVSPDGLIYRSWRDLPYAVKRRFSRKHSKQAASYISQEVLLDEYIRMGK